MLTKFNKLRKISLSELIFRFKTNTHKRYEKIKNMIAPGALTNSEFLKMVNIDEVARKVEALPATFLEQPSEILLEHMKIRNNPTFFIQPETKSRRRESRQSQKTMAKPTSFSPRLDFLEIIETHFPNIISKSIEVAEKICNHEFSFLGIDVKYDKLIAWYSDPLSLEPWPMKFHTDVEIVNGDIGYGDFKHVWELNRHQFLIDLGKAYWLTGDEKYAEEYFGLVESWINSNPYKIGMNWTSSLEVAVRSISWIWAYFFCIDSPHLDTETNSTFLKWLYLHGEYIEKHLSFYFSPYNHLIGEATALFMIGTLFPEFKNAERWKLKGWRILADEIDKQFHEDGFTVEQASSYHHFTLGFYLMAALLRRLNGEQVSEKAWKVIEKAIEFCMYMMKPDGTVPMIGDGDDAMSIYFSQPLHWDFRSLLSMGAVLFNRSDMKKMSGGFAEETLWLLGMEGFKKYQALEQSEPAQTSKPFYHSGYYIMRDSWKENAHYLCFDCGEQSAGLYPDSTPSAAHGHADFLSFDLSAFGKLMLVDPGFYSYNAANPWRNYFRKTKAHNTIVVDGKDQSKHLGNMNWSHVAKPNLKFWMSANLFDYVEGSHDGYAKGDEPVIHNRAIFFKKKATKVQPKYWIIRDRLEGEGEHSIESYFHFSPTELNIEFNSNSISTQNEDNKNILMQSVNKELEMEIISEGNDNPCSGWIATSYGCRVKSPILKYSMKAILPTDIVTVIIPFHSNKPSITIEKLNTLFKLKEPSRTAEERQSLSSTAFKINFDNHDEPTGRFITDYYLFSDSHNQTVIFDKFTTDGHTAFIRTRNSCESRYEISEVSIIRGSFLAAGEKQLVELEKPVDFLNASYISDKLEVELSEDIDCQITLN